MNFVQTTKYGQSRLALTYTDEELNEEIGNFIVGSNEFTYTQLCNHILHTAEKEDKLKKELHTVYTQILLTNNDSMRICKMLWERIWAKEVMILFHNMQDMFHRNEETYFIAIR